MVRHSTVTQRVRTKVRTLFILPNFATLCDFVRILKNKSEIRNKSTISLVCLPGERGWERVGSGSKVGSGRKRWDPVGKGGIR